MPKRRGGQKSEKARKGSAEPDAEHSGSEDEPMAEPPMPTPYVRQLDMETQTDPMPLTMRHFKETGRIIGGIANEITSNNYADAETQTPGQAGSVWELIHSIPGYHPRNDQDRVMFSRAAMHFLPPDGQNCGSPNALRIWSENGHCWPHSGPGRPESF